MKWVSHIAIAGAITAPIDPMAVPAATLGATAPDWLEWVLTLTGYEVRHRTVTHYLAVWLLVAVFGAFVWDFYHHAIMWFALGAASHWLCDSLTIQGVPLGWWSDRRVHMFGGRIRTGSAAEYIVVAAAVGVAAFITQQTHAAGFSPFFYNWGALYEQGIIDGAEWRLNRFRYL